jgi:hypothetical protein
MQPYFFPYIGYFQLIGAVDQFVIYDTVKYTKKGWINRNRMLRNGVPVTFTIPLEKASDYLYIRDRKIAPGFDPLRLRGQIEGAYRKAPEFAHVMPLVEAALMHESDNLFDYISHALELTCAHLGLKTPICKSSAIEGATDLMNQDRVLDICERVGATTYINPVGGVELYDAAAFSARGI